MTRPFVKLMKMMVILTLLLSNAGQATAAPIQRAAPQHKATSSKARPNHLVQLRTPQAHPQTPARKARSAQGSNAVGWTTLITDSFESFPTDWALYRGDLDQVWGSTTITSDVGYNPASLNSVWPAAAGVDATDPISGTYPDNMDTWMIRGPLDLTAWKAAELDFSLNYDIEEGDWLGVCVASFTGAPAPSDFDQEMDCSWLYGKTDGWEYDSLNLDGFLGASDVYVAFVFQSDSSNDASHAGPFIDELAVWTNDTEVQLTDPENDFVDWTRIITESFDTLGLPSNPRWKVTATPASSAWVTTTGLNDDAANPLSTTSVSPTPDHSYLAGAKSWLFSGPIDLSQQVAADVAYSVNYNLLYSDDENPNNDDWLAFCAFASDKALANITQADVNFDNCDWWSGDSGNAWEKGSFDLTPFAGRSQVYLAWYFESNNANAAGGLFVDELAVEAQAQSAVVPPEVSFEAAGLDLTNGDFANGLTSWSKQAPSGKTGDVTAVNGAAVVTGNQQLSQNFTVPNDATDVNIYFDYAISTTETIPNTDNFCVSLTPVGNPTTLLADVGCWDVNHVPEFARDGKTFDHFGYSIPQTLLDTLHGQAVALVIELSQNASLPTTLLLDNVVIYSVGKAARNPTSATGQAASIDAVSTDAAAPRDANEPNDTFATATLLACNQSKAGVFGDVAGTVNKDLDLFKLDRIPVGKLVITTDAAKLNPASGADSYLILVDAAGNKVAENDDDGKSLDSLLVYTNTLPNATYYVYARNYNEDGPNAFYTIKAQCGETVTPPAVQPSFTPPTQTSSGNKPWTLILLLNGEDQKCVEAGNPASCWDKATYEKVVQAMESFMGAKQTIMNVVVLIDGPNYGGAASDVTRYVVQPNGAYTLGVNKWTLPETNMGDPKTLVDFANWAMTNYPADHYYLSVDDHGGGISGTSWDHHDVGGKAIDDQLTPAELRSALAQITRNGERKLDIFAYESCLMGLLENVYDLKDYATYITAFQSISWTALQYPEYFKDLTATDTVEQVAKRIIQAYPVTNTQTPYTFGLIQTNQLDAVKTRLDAFATGLMGANLATLTTIRNATQAFAGSPSQGDATSDAYGELDLWDFAQRVKTAGIAVNEATALQAAIDTAVISKKAVLKGRTPVWDYSNYHGLSITYPNGAYGALDAYCQQYKLSDHGKGSWAKFLTTKAFAGYVWDCGGAAVVQSAGVQQAGARPLRLPVFLQPKPLAEDIMQNVYLPVVMK
ncbi:MAG: clostripain-related cysteine peptidase [Chloroflexi bacterium]|nr:clostripain-related cysteine peptidase [Chloroflexota bacterium]